MTRQPRTGRVIYGKRAFLQDAEEAMRGDIVRALIELITNSDDAYGDGKGRILVEVEHCHGCWRVIVRDRAKGMRSQFMEKAIARLGEQTSGFEAGKDVRGNLGRGAKDVASFGQVVFESICEDRYSKMVLEKTGEYTLYPERSATQAGRDQLGIKRGSGTVVTVHVDQQFRCPQHSNLVEKLSKHYQLRDILADSQREVLISDLGKKSGATKLTYDYPQMETVFNEVVKIQGYPNAIAVVTIRRSSERFDDTASDPYRPGGLLVKGRRAIYESTLFRYENNPHSGWFCGTVRCECIDELAREYDRRLLNGEAQDERNPFPIITRRRDGLQRNHPFYRALAAAVEEPLGALVSQEEERARKAAAHESPRIRRALDSLGRDLARLIDEDLKEIEEEGLSGGPVGDPNAPWMKLIPECPILYMGENKTVSVQVRAELDASDVDLKMDPEGVVELLDGNRILLSPHRKRTDLLAGQIHLRPLIGETETLLTVGCKGHSAVSLLEVRSERPAPAEPIPPDTLRFERDIYRVSWLKRKTITLEAPIELVDKFGEKVRITSSDAGVVVMGGGALKLDYDLEYFRGLITIEGRTLGAKSKLRAELGPVTATCNVLVSQTEEGPGLIIRIVDEEAGHRRAIVEKHDEQNVIRIMGRHPTMRRYLGPAPDFPGQEFGISKALIAEIVAGEATRMVMERKFGASGDAGLIDAAMFYAEHFRYLSRYLTRCHQALVQEADLRNPESERGKRRARSDTPVETTPSEALKAG